MRSGNLFVLYIVFIKIFFKTKTAIKNFTLLFVFVSTNDAVAQSWNDDGGNNNDGIIDSYDNDDGRPESNIRIKF